ncbi:MAG: T9SS type A sorting domain-containing protein [Saprospiraceae bacterium]
MKYLPTDGKGTITIEGLKAGQYSLAFASFNITSTESQSTEYISLFPNPATNKVFLSLDKNEINDIVISDIEGRSCDFNFNSNGNLIEINTSGLNSGLYFVEIRLKDAQKSMFGKFIKY